MASGGRSSLLGDVEQPLADRALDRQAVVHQLEEEVLLAEDVPVVRRGLQRLVGLAEPQPGLHLAGRAAGGGDDPLGVLGDQLAVHARLAVVALACWPAMESVNRLRRPVALPREHGHVRVGAGAGDVAALAELVGAALARLAPEHRLLVVAAGRRDVGLDADDRLDRRSSWRAGRTRRRRTCCRGRSSPPRASRAARPRRTAARPWRRRRASSTRCAHADERRNQPPRGITLRREHDHQRAPRVACWQALRACAVSTAQHRQFCACRPCDSDP